MANLTALWSSVGSAGTVNPPDTGKVVLVGSIVQLGEGRVITGSPEAARRVAPVTQAVIRYAVSAVIDTPINPIRLGLEILWRQGDGQIAARLAQVSKSLPVPTVEENNIVEYQAQPVDNSRTLFYWQTKVVPDVYFDFQNNAYYVEVVLSASGNVVLEYPPAVSAMQLVFER
jgi:hypothetical protein